MVVKKEYYPTPPPLSKQACIVLHLLCSPFQDMSCNQARDYQTKPDIGCVDGEVHGIGRNEDSYRQRHCAYKAEPTTNAKWLVEEKLTLLVQQLLGQVVSRQLPDHLEHQYHYNRKAQHRGCSDYREYGFHINSP